MKRRVCLTAISILLISCAETACAEKSQKPYKAPDLPSYHFNSIEVSDNKGKTTHSGDYYVESGFRSWTITINNISTKYATYVVNHEKFRGNQCENYPAIQYIDGKTAETQIYVCNEGKDVYQTFSDATIHFYNEKTESPLPKQ